MTQGTGPLAEALRSEVPAGLSARIQGALSRARARQERMRHAIRMGCTGLSLASFGGLFFSIKAFLTAATASGFTAYASLSVSDSSIVSAHLSSFLEGLAESLPNTEVTVVLALVAVFLVSLRNAVAFGMYGAKETRSKHTRVHAA